MKMNAGITSGAISKRLRVRWLTVPNLRKTAIERYAAARSIIEKKKYG
jgi:hypothetical protein